MIYKYSIYYRSMTHRLYWLYRWSWSFYWSSPKVPYSIFSNNRSSNLCISFACKKKQKQKQKINIKHAGLIKALFVELISAWCRPAGSASIFPSCVFAPPAPTGLLTFRIINFTLNQPHKSQSSRIWFMKWWGKSRVQLRKKKEP